MRRTLSLILALFSTCFTAFSQGEIPVDLYTGTPSITVPLGSVSAIDVSQPIVLSYNVNSQQRSWYGQGWSLQAGGSVSREVRGLPDDFGYNDTASPPRKGWLYSYGSGTVASEMAALPALSDTLSSTYGTQESNDFARLNAYQSTTQLLDTEPDIFTYSVNGMSGKFVLDNATSSPTWHTIPYRDIKIETNPLTGADKKITWFKITTNDGYSYTFSEVCTASRKLMPSYLGINILQTETNLYGTVAVSYNVEWMLTEIKSPAGNKITYTYVSGNLEISIPDETVNVCLYNEDLDIPAYKPYLVKELYVIKSSRNTLIPSTVVGSTGENVTFSYRTDPYPVSPEEWVFEGATFRDTRKGTSLNNQIVKEFVATYIPVSYTKVTDQVTNYLYARKFLRTLTESSGCAKMPPYTFSYNVYHNTSMNVWEVTLQMMSRNEWLLSRNFQDINYPITYVYPNKPFKDRYRPDFISGQTNTQLLDGSTRVFTNSGNDALAKIQYPSGGQTSFLFERNMYFDELTNKDAPAEGLRIKNIIYADGTGRPPIVKDFSYLDASGKSSGRIFRKPIYTLPAFQWKDIYIPSSTNSSDFKSYDSIPVIARHKYLTLRTEWSIAPNDADNIIGYARVKVSRPGSGYAIHEFSTPGRYGLSKDGTWETPETKIARQSSSINTMNTIFQYGGPWRFPNAPNPFYDYARGLSLRVSEYNEAGKPIRKRETVYQKLFKTDTSAFKVFGVRYERFPLSEDNITNNRIYLFSKYFLLTDEDRVPKTETVTEYDASDATGTKYVTETTEYTYASTYPKLLTQIKRTTSDGNIYRTKFKYPKDYANQPTGEEAVQMLYKLATEFRHGAPVETVSTLQKGAGAELVTGASVVKYSAFGYPGKVFPESQLALILDAPISDFSNSSIINALGYKFSIDARYKQQSAVRSTLSTGLPLLVMSFISRDSAETGYGYNNTLPVIKSSKVTAGQSAFSDFDNTNNFSFSYGGTPYFAAGRSGNGWHPGITLYKENIARTSAENYLLSLWVKSTTTFDLTVRIKSVNGSTTYQTLTLPVTPTGDVFKRLEKLIPFSTTAVAASVKMFRLEMVASEIGSIPPGGFTSPVIDDIFFFPEGTHLETYTYQVPYGVSSVTTGEGAVSYAEYDGLGRETIVRDRDRNILKRTSYITPYDDDPLYAVYQLESTPYVNASLTFSAARPTCVGTVTYEWDWGDGAGYQVGTATQTHIFTSTGEKTVKLRTSAIGFTTKVFTTKVTILPAPVTASICAKGVYEFNSTSATVTSFYPSCPQVSPDPPSYRTTFKVYNVTGCESGCTYTWKWHEIGQWNFLEVATGTDQYTSSKIVTNTRSFEVKCEIKRGNEAPVTFGPMQVYVNP